MASFVLSFFPLDVLDGIWDLIESVSDGFLTYSCTETLLLQNLNYPKPAEPRTAIGRASDSQVRGPGFDTRSGNIVSFLLPLFQEGQLSVTGKSMCTKYWLTA